MSTPQPTSDARDRILDAAEEAFASGGYAGGRVAAIAESAGVNKAMLYYYFGNKSELYQAVLERTLDAIAGLAQGALTDATAPPDQRVTGFLQGYFRILRERPRFPRIVMREILDGGERLTPLLAPLVPALVATFGQGLVMGQAAGHLNPTVDPRYAAMVLLSPFVVFANTAPFFEDVLGIDAEAAAAAYEGTALTLLMEGLKVRGGEG